MAKKQHVHGMFCICPKRRPAFVSKRLCNSALHVLLKGKLMHIIVKALDAQCNNCVDIVTDFL